MHKQNKEIEELIEFSRGLLARNYSLEEIEKEIMLKTKDEELQSKIMRKTKKAQNEKRRKAGVLKLILGGLILIVGFIITVLCFHSNVSFHTIMFSLTSVGCVLLFWGLFDIIG